MITILKRVTVALALFAALSPSAAFAQEAAPALDVQLWLGAEPGQTVIVVGQSLPPATELPATVRIPIPAGAQVVWAGEIAPSGGGTEDPQREFKVVPGTGGDVVEFTASQYRSVQVEAIGGPITQQGNQVSASMKWVQSEPATVTAFSVRVPPGATDVEITPPSGGPPNTNEIGEKLYALPLQRLAPGDSADISVTYVQGAGAGAAPDQQGGSPLLPWLIGAFVVATGALAFLVLSQRRGGEAEEGAEEDADEGAEEDADEGAEEAPEEERSEPDGDDDAPFLLDD